MTYPNINSIMSLSPYLEVLIRNLYWRIPSLVSKINNRKRVRKTRIQNISSKKFIKHISDMGIKNNEIIIMHSSYQALRADNESPERIISNILEFVGINGTLAMPAIPLYSNEPKITERMTADVSNLILTYDLINTPAWTGVLPNALIKTPGSVRSFHPLNTLVAIGPEAKEMMSANMTGNKPLPCGLNSSWYYCYSKDAKIIAVGTDLAHSLTMIHVAEDMQDEKWVVSNWYRDRKFRLVTAGNKRGDIVTVRERHPKWAMFYAERTLSKDLIRKGITLKSNVGGVDVEIISSRRLIEYLIFRNKSGYPYYLVPIRKN